MEQDDLVEPVQELRPEMAAHDLHDLRLDLTDAARAWLGRVGYDPVYGARPLKRAVQKYLQDPLADEILAGRVADGSTVKVDEGDGGLVLQPA